MPKLKALPVLSFEQAYQESLSLLESLLKISALSGQEQEKADFLFNQLLAWGLNPQRKQNNVWLDYHPAQASKTIWMHSHMDTVPAASTWTSDPYKGTWMEGKLTGLGSNDAGASVVSMLAAFRLLVAAGFSERLIWVAGTEEENSGPNGISSLLNLLPPADLALIGEPTGMHAAVAERGLMVVDGVVHGKAGHAARNEGENAIYKAMADIDFFRTVRFEKVSDTLGEVGLNLTVIQAGSKHNSIPDACYYTLDIRLNEQYTHDEVLQYLQANTAGELTYRSKRMKASATPKDHGIWMVLNVLTMPVYGSPTLSDWALIPYPSIKIGPGDSARSHTAEEYVLAIEIEEAISGYVKLISNYGKQN